MNLSNMVVHGALCFPEKKALVYGEKSYTYAQVNTSVDQLGLFLTGLGVGRGDRVALYMPNRPEWIMFYYAAARIGAVAVCLAAAYKKTEVLGLINDSLSSVVVTCDELLAHVPPQPEIPHVKEVVNVDANGTVAAILRGETLPGSIRRVDCDGDEPAAILYTGGTTGTPKGAVLTHRNLIYSAQNVSFHERMLPTDVGLCFMPLTHVFGQCHITNGLYYGNATLVLHKGFDMDAILRSIDGNRVTRFYSVPTVYIRFLNNPDARKYLSSLTYVFSAATSMPGEVVRQWMAEYRLAIHESYGMTETASQVTFNHMNRHKVGAVGTPAGIVEVKLVDSHGAEVPAGERGEIIIRGPNVMKGYFNRPDETAATIRDGWLHSGDVGRFDEDGYLYIVDRIKDVIITGGENVFPNEVEDILYRHPAVNECAVVGRPHPEYGETVTAYVTLKPGQTTDEDAIIKFCKGHLAGYKVPKKVFFVEDLPKSPQGKILRRELRGR